MPTKGISVEELRDMNILYVEDDIEIAEVFQRLLSRIVKTVHFAKNGQEALEIFNNNHIDIVMTDIRMPVMNGLELAKNIREINFDMPIIIVSAYSETEYLREAFEVGITHYLNKPVDTLNLKRVLNESAKSVTYKKRQNQMKKNFDETISAFLNLIEKRDRYTAGHTNRVANYCEMIAVQMGFTESEVHLLKQAALLHDIGKIEIPDSILLKPHRLNELEYEIIKEHLISGYNVLSQIEQYKDLAEIILYHHERFDGMGYPNGLKGDEIPRLAQIMIVADAFDAMTTDRIYKPKKSLEEALIELKELSSIQFHPEVVDVAVKVLKDIEISDIDSQFPIGNLENKKFDYFFSDRVTEVGNEDYFAMLLNQNEIKRYKYIGILDIEKMTTYNDIYGWKQGNILLKEIAYILKEKFPNSPIFRTDGDNFIVLSKDEIVFDVDYLKDMIKNSKIVFKFNKLPTSEYLKNHSKLI